VDPAAAERAQARVQAAQAALRSHWPGLEARLWRREGGARPTLMETYAHPGGVDPALKAEIDAAMAAALDGLDAGPRHVEVFVPA
jgi:hypothetical protein